MGICLRYAYTSFEAGDIFHDAFVKVFKYINSYKGQGSFEGWMRHIFVNTAINHFHKNKKHYYHDDNSEYDHVPDLPEDALSKLAVEELLKLINKLPEGYKMVFNLYVVEGYSHKEIADMLQVSEGTSKSQLSKAKALLKKYLIKKSSPDYVNGE